jgi:hypothetical protein
VTKDFADLKDGGHVYLVGDVYPREGYHPDETRVGELSSENNKRKEILITNKKGQAEEPKLEMESLSAAAIRQYTNDEIKVRLDELGIEYKSSDNKDKLIVRLKGGSGQ